MRRPCGRRRGDRSGFRCVAPNLKPGSGSCRCGASRQRQRGVWARSSVPPLRNRMHRAGGRQKHQPARLRCDALRQLKLLRHRAEGAQGADGKHLSLYAAQRHAPDVVDFPRTRRRPRFGCRSSQAFRACRLRCVSPFRSAHCVEVGEQRARPLAQVRAEDEPLGRPAREGVLVGEVFLRGGPHHRRRREAMPLPREATINRPPQDARPLGPQRFAKARIGLRRLGVERCCPSTRQARRSDTPSAAVTCPMQARRRAGLSRFPKPPLSGSACPASARPPPSAAARSHARAPSAAAPGRSSDHPIHAASGSSSAPSPRSPSPHRPRYRPSPSAPQPRAACQ
jgi:hypothetical protein